MASSGTGTVKAVLSGDTLVLIGRAVNGPPPELMITLSHLMAPKLGRGPPSGGGSAIADEPFAWLSREHLRKLCIGKPVKFKVDYKRPNRTFGTVVMQADGAETNLGLAVAKEGWARVKEGGDQAEGESDAALMKQAGAEAEAAKKGIYSEGIPESQQVRRVTWSDVDSQALLARHMGTPVKVIVEHVRDGASLRCLVLDSMTMINLALAGVSCPRMNTMPRAVPALAANSDRDSAAAPVVAEAPRPEPFAAEARHFTEIRLLNREIEVLLEMADKYGNFHGTCLHNMGNISEAILKQGLGRMVDWTAACTSRANATAMRAAENTAKQNQLRLWKGWTPPVITGDSEYTGTVVEVHSGDQLTVAVSAGAGQLTKYQRVALASLKAPRMGNPRRNVADEPWAYEAKENLRSKAIGKAVAVTVEYDREIPQGEGNESITRPFVTIMVGKATKAKNLAETLVADGLATVIRHRQDDPRSSHYEALISAEQAAEKAKKGLHGKGEPPAHRHTDLTQDSKRAKQYLPFLQREREMRAIVEHVFTGSRFKVLVPKENCSFMVALSMIKCPQPAKQDRKAEPFGDAARAFTRDTLMQRMISLVVTDMDRNGVALGDILVGQGATRHSYAEDLLRAGLARVDPRGLERLGETQAAQLQSAQEEARSSKSNIWSVATSVAQEDKPEPKYTAELVPVKLSDIVDGGRFFVKAAGDAGDKAVEKKLQAFKEEVGVKGGPCEVKRGTLLAALYDDGTGPAWFRAKVEGTASSGGLVTVRYIDHGNVAQVPMSKLHALDRSHFTATPALAKECTLAFVKAPRLDEEWGNEAATVLQDVWGKDILMQTLGHGEDGCPAVALYACKAGKEKGELGLSLNENLVAEGVARVASRSRPATPEGKKLVEKLKETQQAALKRRVAMWRYGDCGSDDEDGF